MAHIVMEHDEWMMDAFVCTAVRPHTCTSDADHVRRTADHAFEAPQLACILMPLAINQKKKLKPEVMQQTLQPYLSAQPKEAFCRKVFDLAKK